MGRSPALSPVTPSAWSRLWKLFPSRVRLKAAITTSCRHRSCSAESSAALSRCRKAVSTLSKSCSRRAATVLPSTCSLGLVACAKFLKDAGSAMGNHVAALKAGGRCRREPSLPKIRFLLSSMIVSKSDCAQEGRESPAENISLNNRVWFTDRQTSGGALFELLQYQVNHLSDLTLNAFIGS